MKQLLLVIPKVGFALWKGFKILARTLWKGLTILARTLVQQIRKHKVISWLVGIILTAVITYPITEDIMPRVWPLIRKPFEKELSPTDQAINRLMSETESAQIWHRPPILFPASQDYIRANFSALDPSHPPDPSRLPEISDVASLPDLVRDPGAYAGQRIGTIGHFGISNVATTASDDNAIWIIQLYSTSPGGKDILVYCQITARHTLRMEEGELILVSGVVLAAGTTIDLSGGYNRSVYMLADEVHPTATTTQP
jgi:hypothetical protein